MGYRIEFSQIHTYSRSATFLLNCDEAKSPRGLAGFNYIKFEHVRDLVPNIPLQRQRDPERFLRYDLVFFKRDRYFSIGLPDVICVSGADVGELVNEFKQPFALPWSDNRVVDFDTVDAVLWIKVF